LRIVINSDVPNFGQVPQNLRSSTPNIK
jgi:hypothetical protein